MASSKSKSKSPTKRSLGVILEDIDSKFQQVLEGHAALDKKLDEKFDGLAREFHEFRFETKDNFKAVFDYLSRIDDDIQDIRKTLNRKADLERLERLEKEVAQIKLVIQKWQK